MNSALRMLFPTMSVMILVGIALTGFATVYWLLYVPVVFLAFAAVTGICPGLIFWKKLGFGK